MYFEQDTIVALATPPGNAALALFRLSGPQSLNILQSCVQRDLGNLPARQAHVLWFWDDGQRIDQCVVTFFAAPRSFTGEDMAEISCHGGRAVVASLLRLLLKSGARAAQAGEFSQRAFLNGKMDLAQAEAIADLIHAQTDLARQAAQAQLQGGLSRKLQDLRQRLITILAHIEAGLDHSDDPTIGNHFSMAQTRPLLDQIHADLTRLIDTYRCGKIARQGIKIALLGRPNVGKSSLLNALLRNDRAIVSAIAGTTRDTLEESFDLHGISAILVDTAGIRAHTSDVIESLGIQRTHQSLQECDLACIVLDASSAWSDQDQAIIALTAPKKRLFVLNKSDKAEHISLQSLQQQFPSEKWIKISCQTGSGIEILTKTMYELVQGEIAIADLQKGEVWITSLRHLECLTKAQQSLQRAIDLCQSGVQEECFALELAQVLEFLGEIVGQTTSQDILSAIFSQFCIGK